MSKHGHNATPSRPWTPPGWFRYVQAAWLVLVAVFVVWYFRKNWAQFRNFSWDVNVWWALAALGCAALRRLLGGLRWTAIALYPGNRWTLFNVAEQLSVYFISGLAIYIPGNVWFIANRIYLGKQSGLTVAKSSLALVYETGVILWSAIIVGSYAGLSLAGASRATSVFLGLVFLVLTVFLFEERSINFLLVRLARLTRRPMAPVHIAPGWVAGVLALSFSILIVGGGSLYCVLKALGVGDPGNPAYIVSALALAWTLGFCVPWAPSGLGVQEGFILYFLRYLAAPAPAIAAICLRLLYMFEDVLWGGLALVARSCGRRHPTPFSMKSEINDAQ